MFRSIALLVLATLALTSAFAPAQTRSLHRFAGCKIASLQAASKPGPTYWEGSHPPSSVLGIGEKVPSGVFGPLSLVAFAVGLICVHENNISTGLSATTVNPQTVAGSLLVPISWGMHVAAWIQKKNGK